MAKTDEEQKQRKSAADRVNSGINNLRSAQKNIQRTVKTVRLLAQGAQAAASSLPVLGPPIALLLAAILLLFLAAAIIIIIFGGSQSGGKNNLPITCNSVGGNCYATSCPSGTTKDTSGATCNLPTSQVCCLPNQAVSCADTGGSCTGLGQCQPPNTINDSVSCPNTSQVCCLYPGAKPNIHFYCQYDRSYTKNGCDIIGSGCTPTSVSMILASFGQTQWNPYSTAKANGGLGCGGASSLYDFLPWIRSQGYSISPNLANGANFNVSLAKKLISQGYYIVAGANITFRENGALTNQNGQGPHAFVITDIDANNVATVYDPTFCNSDSDFAIRRFNVLGGKPPLICNTTEGCDWFWAIAFKKN